MAHPKRRLGQHFLFDPGILGRIAEATGAGPGDTVTEIGPGPGGLTAALLARGAHVVAIERDPDVLPALLARAPDVTVVEGDALALDWHEASGAPEPRRWIIAGNIPYNITSPLLAAALAPPLPRAIVFLVQAEVAERLGAEPGTRAYGALTVGVRALARVELLFRVRPGAFRPPPKVESAAVRLTPRETPLVTAAEQPAFRATVAALFAARRKQLLRALRTAAGLDAAAAGLLLDRLGLDPTVRPETLAPEDFVRISRALIDGGAVGE